jgi:hypothetical protein
MPPDRSRTTQLTDQLESLYSEDPRRYALLQQYIGELRYALDQSNRNYVSAKQLHATWDDPPFQPQILGQLLSTAATLGVLRVHAHRSNRNRYDLTGYDPDQMQQLSTLLTVDTDSREPHATSDQ